MGLESVGLGLSLHAGQAAIASTQQTTKASRAPDRSFPTMRSAPVSEMGPRSHATESVQRLRDDVGVRGRRSTVGCVD
jgi:hypothetical protein